MCTARNAIAQITLLRVSTKWSDNFYCFPMCFLEKQFTLKGIITFLKTNLNFNIFFNFTIVSVSFVFSVLLIISM